MSFIEYRIINDNYFLCTYRSDNKNIVIPDKVAEEKFKLLKEVILIVLLLMMVMI